MAIPEGTLAGEEIGIAEGVLAGELLAEGAAMLEYGFWFLGLPLLLDWMSGGLAADEAARRREEINEAWKAATPEIQSALRRLGVGDDPSGDYAGILQQTKEGKTIYANIEFQLVAPSTAWHGYAMLTPEEAGQPRNRDDAELTDSPSASLAAESEYWATESKRFRIRLIDVRLSTSNIHQDEGGGTYVMSLAVYSPKALATELLSNVPETA